MPFDYYASVSHICRNRWIVRYFSWIYLLFTHLFRLTSLRKPYALFYPTRQQSVKDSWIRFPLTMIDTRDVQTRPQHVKAAKGISTKHRSDFDD